MPVEPTRILITGTSGQVGGALLQTLAHLGNLLAPPRAELDLADPASVRQYLRDQKPHWIVNAAAYTGVDKAESEPELAHALNAEAPRILGEEAATIGARVIHFSTDYVFDGQKPTPYLETDPTGPLGVYGATKLAGEQALLATGAQTVILRTSWVYGATGKNFLLTILHLARERDELRIVADQHGAPTWSHDLARLTARIIRTSVHDLPGGIYHASGRGETTWAAFAAEAIRLMQLRNPSRTLAHVTPIPTTEYPTPAARPAYSLLSGAKLQQTFGYSMLEWQESLIQVLAELS